MQLFAPERPTTNGHKTILTDGSPIPPIVSQPLPTGQVRFSVLLATYDGNNSYGYRTVDLQPFEIEQLYRILFDDPERCYRIYFGWTPRVHSAIVAPPAAKAVPIGAASDTRAYVNSLL